MRHLEDFIRAIASRVAGEHGPLLGALYAVAAIVAMGLFTVSYLMLLRGTVRRFLDLLP